MRTIAITVWIGIDVPAANFDYGSILSARTVKVFTSEKDFKSSKFKPSKNFNVAAVLKNGQLEIKEQLGSEYVNYLFLENVPKHINLKDLATLKRKLQGVLFVNAKMVDISNSVFKLGDKLLSIVTKNKFTTADFSALEFINKEEAA